MFRSFEKFEELKYMISLIQECSNDLSYGDISYIDHEFHEVNTELSEDFFDKIDILESKVKTLRDWARSYNSGEY